MIQQPFFYQPVGGIDLIHTMNPAPPGYLLHQVENFIISACPAAHDEQTVQREFIAQRKRANHFFQRFLLICI